MGIVTNALVIVLCGLLGSKFQKLSFKNYRVLAIGIMLTGLVGFLENVYNVQEGKIASENFIVVLLSFIIGSKIGEVLRIEDRLSNISRSSNKSFNAVIDASLYFGVGGLQISGPMLLALNCDNTQLFFKSLIDIPFALAFGSAFGKVVSLSAVPVAVIQIIIFFVARFFTPFISSEMTAELCAVGYIILFFSGYNLMAEGKNKINNINMLPGILLVILYNIVIHITEWL